MRAREWTTMMELKNQPSYKIPQDCILIIQEWKKLSITKWPDANNDAGNEKDVAENHKEAGYETDNEHGVAQYRFLKKRRKLHCKI